MTHDWDAATYERVSEPQAGWAEPVIDRLELRGDETVLDAGCGSGRVTRMLLDRLPRGRVIAVDASPAMVEKARATLGGRATVMRADLNRLELDEPVDAVFSNAVFHWVEDHDALFAGIHSALRPGGRLSAQLGGAGNLAGFFQLARDVMAEEPFADHFAGWREPWHFESEDVTAERLRAAGFDEVRVWLERSEPPVAEPREFARAVCLSAHVDALPPELRVPFVDEVLARVGGPLVLDHVGMQIAARRGEEA